MIEGTLKWLSLTQEFGLVAPRDGSRVVFVRFSSSERSGSTDVRGGLPAEVIAVAEGQREKIEPLPLAAKVEVRTRYQVGHWAPGYEIADVVDTGYHVRRPGSRREMLPDIFVRADVRRAGQQ
jgi:cold shock CspA family protein